MPLFDSLYNYACWLTSNREEAKDLVQETYLKGLKGFSSFQQGTNFRAWMYRILRNSFLTSRSGLKQHAEVSLDDEDEPAEAATTETPESILIDRSTDEIMQRAIEEIPVVFREVLLLCDVEEMSYREISEALSIPMGTVMSRLARARRVLREGVKKRMKEG